MVTTMTGSATGNGPIAGGADTGRLSWSLRSDPGEVRPENEDFVAVHVPPGDPDAWDRSPLFVVADGMGGHAAGEVASRLAAETVIEGWSAPQAQMGVTGMRSVVRAANLAVHQAATEPGRAGMGTTLTALSFDGGTAAIAHVGDSRAYLVRGDSCVQLTSDHSRVGEMLRMRLLTPEQAANHPMRSQLTRSLGADLLVQIDLVREPAQLGDTFVLCSDGLWDVVSRTDITNVVATNDGEQPGTVASRLVDLALERGTADNVSAVVVTVTASPPIAPEGRRSFFRRRS